VYFEDVFDPQLSKVVMVDHSAPSQMVGCLKKRLIDDGCTDVLQGIIDHHALDENIYTKAPLFMDVRPWGSMSTIITHSFLRSALPIPVDVARLLLCAIMSDTVNLTSPTTTLADRYIVPLLCKFCGETDHNGLAKGLFKAKTAWFVTLTPFECVVRYNFCAAPFFFVLHIFLMLIDSLSLSLSLSLFSLNSVPIKKILKRRQRMGAITSGGGQLSKLTSRTSCFQKARSFFLN